jgi:hypothetical protein
VTEKTVEAWSLAQRADYELARNHLWDKLI